VLEKLALSATNKEQKSMNYIYLVGFKSTLVSAEVYVIMIYVKCVLNCQNVYHFGEFLYDKGTFKCIYNYNTKK
jgi:hypothetical protein